MKPIEVKYNTYIDSTKEVNDKNSKFEVDDLVRISKYKYIYAKEHTPNWSEEVLWLKKLKILFHGNISLLISMVKKLLETFINKTCKKQINKDLRQKKSLKEKEMDYMSNGKEMIIHLIAGLIKKDLIK